MNLYGREISREDLLRYANPSSLFGLRRIKLEGQGGVDVRAVEAKNAAGLRAVFIQDKCLDPLELSYMGHNIGFLNKNGLTSQASYLSHDFDSYWSGNMITTCGLRNAGPPCEVDGERFPFHGSIANMQAEICTSKVADDFSEMLLEGVMRETVMYGHNLALHRTIRIPVNQARIEITDKVINNGPESQIYFLMYHINFGYPFLDEGLNVTFPNGKIIPKNEAAKKNAEQYDRIPAPVDGFDRHVYFVDAKEKGRCEVTLENKRLGIGARLVYDNMQFPFLQVWKNPRSGDYAFGIEPSTSRSRGRAEELKDGYDTRVPGFGSVETRLALECYCL